MAFRDMFKATEYKQRVEELESMLTPEMADADRLRREAEDLRKKIEEEKASLEKLEKQNFKLDAIVKAKESKSRVLDDELLVEEFGLYRPRFDFADAHPRGFMVHAQGGCMDNRFPHDALLLVDPDMEPVNGQPVLAETSDYGAVVRNYTRGRSTVMLTADSHSGEYDDTLAGPGDEPVVCKGRVVWYMGERDER